MAERNPSAQLINVNEQFFLFDCGEGTQIQMRRNKLKFSKVNEIFITHLHGDHYFGLIGYLSSLHLLGRSNEMKIFGPKDLETVIRTQLKLGQSYLSYPLQFIHVNPKSAEKIYENKNIEVMSVPLDHRIACTGYLIREKERPLKINIERAKEDNISHAYYHNFKQGENAIDESGGLLDHRVYTRQAEPTRSYAYISDTAYFPDICEHISRVNLLYHEATFINQHQARARKTKHSTAEEAAKIAKEAEVDKLILGHFSARYKDLSQFLIEANPIFDKCILAEDGLTVDIPLKKS
jgi:ribonuclease Z